MRSMGKSDDCRGGYQFGILIYIRGICTGERGRVVIIWNNS